MHPLSKLDHAVNAALALAQVALFTGDRVGLLAYARNIRQRIAAVRGASHLRQFLESLSIVREEEGRRSPAAGRESTDA